MKDYCYSYSYIERQDVVKPCTTGGGAAIS